MNALYTILLVLILLQSVLSLRIVTRVTKDAIISNRFEKTSLRSGSNEGNEGSTGAAYKKWSCRSCSFIYDESKGFKKRIAPGSRLGIDLKTFACPVCGAAIDQFEEVKE
jgi:rubredoxin